MTKSFLSIGNSPYFPTLALSAFQIQKFHPGAAFGIYDWGLTTDEITFLNAIPFTQVISWKNNFRDQPFKDSYINAICRILNTGRGVKEFIFKGIRGREWLLAQKPYCFLHWVSEINQGKSVFLDGDAFLINEVSELFSDQFDLGVTLRRKREINTTSGHYQVLNSGVIAFSGSKNNNRTLIESWIKQMAPCSREYLVEQTALSHLIYGQQYDISLEHGEIIRQRLKGEDYRIKIFSCEEYNYNWIEEGFNASENRILHFKGGRHSLERFKILSAELGLDDLITEILSVKRPGPYE